MNVKYGFGLILSVVCSLGAMDSCEPNPALKEEVTQPTRAPLKTLNNEKWYMVMNICYTPNGQKLAQAGILDRKENQSVVRLWDTPHCDSYTDLNNNGFCNGGLAISPDNKNLACDFQETMSEYNIKVWDLETQQKLLILKGHTQAVNCLDYSKNNQLLLSGARDGTARIWDARNGKCIKTLVCSEQAAVISQVAWRPDSEQVATCQWENYAKLWDTKTGSFIKTQEMVGELGNVAYSPSGKVLACSQEGELVLCDTVTGKKNNSVAYWPGASPTVKAYTLMYAPHHEETVLTGMYTMAGDIGICDVANVEKSIHFGASDGVLTLTSPDDAATVAVCVGQDSKMVQIFALLKEVKAEKSSSVSPQPADVMASQPVANKNWLTCLVQ